MCFFFQFGVLKRGTTNTMLSMAEMLQNNKEAKDLNGVYCIPTSTHFLAYTNP